MVKLAFPENVKNDSGTCARAPRLGLMSYEVSTDEVWALLTEAEESRRLARTLRDLQAGIDLEAYALALEAQATQLERARPARTKALAPYNPVKSLLQGFYLGRA